MKKKSTEAKMKAEPQVIKMTKIKQWYVVADMDAYKVLKKCGTPLIRVHQNFLPTLGILLTNRNVRVKGVDFVTEILDPFLKKTTETWGRKYGKVQLNSKVIVFTATAAKAAKGETVDPAKDEKLVAARAAVPKLEGLLVDFFARWGYRCQIEYSETTGGGKIKLHVEYWFDSDKLPVLPLEVPAQELRHIQLKLGFARLTLSVDDRALDIKKVETRARREAPVDEGVISAVEKEKAKDDATAESIHAAQAKAVDAYVRRMVDEERLKTRTAIDYINVKFEVSQGGLWSTVHTSKCLPSQVSNVIPMVQALMNVVSLDPHNEDNEAA